VHKFPVAPFCAGLALCLALLSEPGQAQTINVVTEETSYSFIRDGKVAGIASEIAERMLQMAGLTDYRMALYPWARAYDMALLQANVLIYPISRTPARERQFKWVGEMARITPRFYKLRRERSVLVGTLDDARNYTIGVIRDDVRQAYLQARGFTRMVVSASNAENFRKLLNHQVQLIALPEPEVRQQCAQAGIDFAEVESVYRLDEMADGVYFAYSLATPDDVVQSSRAAFERLKAEGGLASMQSDKPVQAASAP
jgi:polar amino acid transport system substrate-binding protein